MQMLQNYVKCRCEAWPWGKLGSSMHRIASTTSIHKEICSTLTEISTIPLRSWDIYVCSISSLTQEVKGKYPHHIKLKNQIRCSGECGTWIAVQVREFGQVQLFSPLHKCMSLFCTTTQGAESCSTLVNLSKKVSWSRKVKCYKTLNTTLAWTELAHA